MRVKDDSFQTGEGDLADLLVNGDDERYQVRRIKAHLLTDDQRKKLFELNLSIEEMLNGEFSGKEEDQVHLIFNDWNVRLGRCVFGG